MPPKIADEPRTERLNVHMTPALKARLTAAREKSGNTMNGEIHARLDATFDDAVSRIAVAVWPTLKKLDEADREKFADMIIFMAGGRKK